MAERPAPGNPVEHLDEAEAAPAEALIGWKARGLARYARKILLERGSVEDLEVLIEHVARGIGLVELGVDLSRPAQRRLLSIAPEHVVDRRVAGQHAGNDVIHQDRP